MLIIQDGSLVVEIKENEHNRERNQSEESQLEGYQESNVALQHGVYEKEKENPIRINMGFANYEEDLEEVIE